MLYNATHCTVQVSLCSALQVRFPIPFALLSTEVVQPPFFAVKKNALSQSMLADFFACANRTGCLFHFRHISSSTGYMSSIMHTPLLPPRIHVNARYSTNRFMSAVKVSPYRKPETTAPIAFSMRNTGRRVSIRKAIGAAEQKGLACETTYR